MRKYDLISALSAETSKEVTRNEESWKKYLNTASRLYKYPFKDQLLIYAQRPDATACASIEIWNEKMHCWVNKGAKGIALLDEEGSPFSGLRYVFDISDVHKARRIGRFPRLWEMREEHQEAVLNRLEGIYGDTDKETGFVDRIREIAFQIAQDCYGELASDMEYLKAGSFLEELDELNIAVRVRETLADSIAYTVLKRCGIEDAKLAEEIEFPYIHEFNTVETLSHIGDSISDLSKPVLMEIGRAIWAYDREISGREASKNFVEKGLANTTNTRYNALKRESEMQDIQSNTQTGNAGERGNNDESDLREERGLHDTDVTDGRAAGGDAHEIRTDEEELLAGTQEGDLYRASAERETERASSDHSGAGGAENGTADRADDEAGGSDRKTQSREPDALGSEDEQYQALSGGNRAEGTGIQPVSEEATEKTENKDLPEPDSGEPLPGLSLSEIEKGIFRFDEFMVHKCPDIAGVMLFEPDKDKQTEYIKNSYRHKEFTEFYVGEERAGYRADENGLTLWKGSYLNRTAEATVSWEAARDMIAFYMEKGEYLKEGQIPQWEEPKKTEIYQQLSLFPTIEEQIGTIEAAQAGEKYIMPAAFSIPQEQLDAILRTGGGRNNSRSRIYAKYQQGKTPEEMTEFLKNEYRTTGKGFDFGNNPISVWFNESGMSIGYGMSAKEAPVMVMGWQEIEGVIRSMVENGSYMGANEVFLVDAVERQRVANDLFNFFRDGIGDVPEDIPIKGYNYPESITNLCELLSTQEGRDMIAGELSHAKEQIETGEKQIKWRYVKNPEHLLSEIADLSTEKTEYPAQDSVEVLHEDFITQDEIDERLTGGSNVHHGQFRIYEYFMEGHDREENIAFLKNEYGTGGTSHALIGSDRSDEWHDSKGIKLGKGKIGDPYAKILLKWNVVEKRIRELVNADKYLTPKGKEAFAQYKKEQAEKAMRREQEKLEHGIRVECKDAIEQAIAENFNGYTFPSDTVEGVIRQYGKERVEIVLANTIMHLSYDGRFSPNNKEWAKSLVPSADWQTRDYIVTSHPAVLDGFTDQARRYIERDREPEKPAEEPEQEETTRFTVTETSDAFAEPFAIWDSDTKNYYATGDGTVPTFATSEEADSFCQNLDGDLQGKETENIVTEPEIDKSGAVNYRISFHEAETTGKGFAPKEKFRQNVEAIRTLEKIEGERRTATPEEQEILAKYVGWGGLADAFDFSKANWASEYQELKSLLSPEEYASARESTLNAHYTSPVIIQAIYDTVGKMGFTRGNMLDPAAGIGNFYGCLPEEMQGSRLYGAELDGITGRIAKQLYPHADIQITGFENTNYPNDFFDVAVGNVPFGQYKVSDRQYDKHNFLIHDYFFAKTLDKVRPGGIVAFVTSKGTMDKKNPEVRKYLAQRAELLGAVRLPNTAFKENAGTEVTSDILFLKKRDRVMDIEPDWVHLTEKDGIVMNQYFADQPEMVLGKMEMVSGAHGMESACLPDTSLPLSAQLKNALSYVEGSIEQADFNEIDDELAGENIPANPEVKNYSYTVVNDKVYYRENSIMKPVDVSEKAEQRMKGMVAIRDCTQELINFQLEEYPDDMISDKQAELNRLYDDFSKKFGLISSQTNKRVFNQDSSYCLLCSLERLDDEGNFIGKADMFTKRTIKKQEVITSVDTASEALAVSLSEKAGVDLAYMSELTGKSKEEITKELAGIIFQNPVTEEWETADEYLSGNVREKLSVARTFAKNHPEYDINVSSLEGVQPKELDASEIEVRIGATWISTKYIEDFMRETFETPEYLFDRNIMGVQYSNVTGQWNVKGKNADRGNALVNMTYGTGRANAYKILEDSLNLRDTRIFDVITEDGKEKRVLNKKETMLASQKQEAIREAFKDWVFRDPERRQDLCAKYNELFNSTRPREYDGSHLKFPGMTPDIVLKPHQLNAVAHQLYGGNTLLAHCVGAGKTFEMIASAMEHKRIGLCQKSLFAVPNHLTEQWASDFLRLYPGANILAATKKDFEPANRKKFCSRIATGDYDAVIIGHSQFEKIPLSTERQMAMIERQIEEIEMAIEMLKAEKGERYSIKQMEKTKKSLSARLSRLNDSSRKDNVVTFEQLGVDRLFVDESHNYKNLFLYTKMRNVAGIAQTEAQKSSDMFAKCQYMDELTGGKGITFATGTPLSNSMTELYTNMRYLQYNTLQRLGLGHFDSWAASFGETQTAIELAPEGTGYRAKTRFAKFFNLPELIALFKESADIQTPDMLKLPVPEADYENIVLKPSEYQQDMVQSLADRAEAVRDRKVQPNIDNMLKITNDGRKLALDQRLINDMLPDEENSKATICVEKAFEIWEQTKEQKSAQLIFCDLSTPKGDGTFNVYEDIRDKLMAKGVPENEIAFIHDANTETRKAELFAKVRSGQVRFLLGSTAKMGAGTNVQDRLIALHHLDVPWRPSDIEQQEGRILRQGNMNDKVKIFRYVTEGTFDSYSWQLIENKQKFIGQIMTSKSPVRSCEDIDEAALTYAEVKALATGNPYIKEKMDLDIQVSKLKLLKANHTSQKYRLEDNIVKHYPVQIAAMKERIAGYRADIQTYAQNKFPDKDTFSIKIGNRVYTDKKEAGAALIDMCRSAKQPNMAVTIGEYQGFKMSVSFDSFFSKFTVNLKGSISHEVEIGTDPLGNLQRLNNALEGMTGKMETVAQKLENVEHQLETAKIEVTKPFAQETELAEKLERLTELNALLNMDEKGGDGIDMDDEPENDGEQEELETEEMGHDAEAVEDVPFRPQINRAVSEKIAEHGKERMPADSPRGRISVREKLAEMRERAYGQKLPEPDKAKNKEECL